MKILIADLGNPKSLGNILTLNSLKKIIREASPDATVVIHCSHPHHRNVGITRFWNSSLFSYLLMEKINTFSRVIRFLRFLVYINFGAYPSAASNGKIWKIYEDYYQSDVILFAGSGNFKSRSLIKGTVELITNLLIMKFARKAGKKLIVLPTTYGPFKTGFHRYLAFQAIKNADYIFTRESRSFVALKKYLGNKVIKSRDLILFSNSESSHLNKDKRLTVGVTFRNWGDKNFENFEIDLIETFNMLSKTYKLSFIPIFIDSGTQQSVEYINYKKFEKYSHSCNLIVRKPESINSNKNIIKCINKLDFMVSLRTNSTLFSISRSLPFLAFSKHEKVKLLLRSLKLTKYFREVEDLNSKAGKEKIIALIEERGKQKRLLAKIASKLQTEDKAEFVKRFSAFINDNSLQSLSAVNQVKTFKVKPEEELLKQYQA